METIKKTAQVLLGDDENVETKDRRSAAVEKRKAPKPGDTILLTGATGFVAGHILHSLLNAGFKVKAAVHSKEKADRLMELYPSHKHDLQTVVVEDIAKEGSFDEAVKGVTGVVHTAYPRVLAKDNNQELFDQAISGATGILNSIVKHNPDIRRVILTSSFAAMSDQHKGNWAGHTYSEADWNPIKYEDALGTTDHDTAYSASKTFAERAAWDFASRHTDFTSLHPAQFTLSSILLPAVIGPIAHDLTTTGSINNSVADIYRLINGCENKVPMNKLWAWADVRDVADAHVAALLAHGKEGGVEDRFLAAAGTYDYHEICDIIERHFPELVKEGGTPRSADTGETPYHYKINNTKVKNELGVKLRGLEESIVDTVKSLLDYEDRTKRGETKEVKLAPVMMSRGDEKEKGREAGGGTPYSVGDGKTHCNCGGNNRECTCPPGSCACEGCGKETEQLEAGGNTPYSVGDGKTECNCGGNNRECTCPPGSCACKDCGKETEQLEADDKVSKEGENVAKKTSEDIQSEESVDKTKEAVEHAQKVPGTSYAKLSGKIDCYCGRGEDNCICPTETCGCRGCARKRAENVKSEREEFGTRQGGGVNLSEPMEEGV